jgi:hypothetical protein
MWKILTKKHVMQGKKSWGGGSFPSDACSFGLASELYTMSLVRT